MIQGFIAVRKFVFLLKKRTMYNMSDVIFEMKLLKTLFKVVVWDDQTGKFHLTAIPEPTSGGKKKFNRHLIITSILVS